MMLFLAGFSSIILAFCIGIYVGKVSCTARKVIPSTALLESADALRELVQSVERKLGRHSKSLAADVTALVSADSPATYSKIIGRLIEGHQAIVG